jgi:hypothetical protein
MEDVTKSRFLNHSRAQGMEIAINFELTSSAVKTLTYSATPASLVG